MPTLKVRFSWLPPLLRSLLLTGIFYKNRIFLSLLKHAWLQAYTGRISLLSLPFSTVSFGAIVVSEECRSLVNGNPD
jgi:hypothetical protein